MNIISLVIPSRNNLKYVKFAYNSIRKYLPLDVEIILLDDASTDGTWKWMNEIKILDDNVKIYRNDGPERVGHTVLYDVGAELASHEIFGIFHADMFATTNYIKNMLKHLKPKTVVSGTRIEPPLHPPGPEKYVKDFGLEPEEFREIDFINFVKQCETDNANKTTNGIFAPWLMYKEDFFAIQGHDKKLFAPMELEDSDLFNRFLLAGYTFIQSRDAFVYHMTCRGSRFKDGIKIVNEIPIGNDSIWKKAQDSDEYTKLREIKFREWWRKWHSDVLHNENMFPIVKHKYNIGFSVTNCNDKLLEALEPWCTTLYVDCPYDSYIEKNQPHTKFNLNNKIVPYHREKTNDIVIEFDGAKLNQTGFQIITRLLPDILTDSAEVGEMEFDIFKFSIKSLNTYEKKLIRLDDPYYTNQLL